jgi:hypothetical protein
MSSPSHPLVRELIALGLEERPRPLSDARHLRWAVLFDAQAAARTAPQLALDDLRALIRGLVHLVRANGSADAAGAAIEWLLAHLSQRDPGEAEQLGVWVARETGIGTA